ncbi:MAG TPA: hypothetical protein DCQ06_12655 [Myxococcales bacterium]|nr:hypothetical protein [Myxococcales bacterium]|tara:strand:+ start:176 stop:547 length:372 start_codon:yes stop_codon:yes gene_type:complete
MNDEKKAIGALLDTYLSGGGALHNPFEAGTTPKPKAASTTVTLVGEAAASMSGAVIVVDGEATLIADFDEWPQDVIGKLVRVSGRMGSVSLGSADDLASGDKVRHGASGSSDMLLDVQWQLVD